MNIMFQLFCYNNSRLCMHYNDLEDKYDSYPFSLLKIFRQTQISFNTISGNLWQE